MGYPTKIQLIKRKKSQQWYLNFPSAVAQAMQFKPSEVVEWIIEDKSQLVLRRRSTPASAMKKKRRKASWDSSTLSGQRPGPASASNGSLKGQKRMR